MDSSLVIGGSKGIGLEIASSFSLRGDDTYVLSRQKGNWQGKHIEADLSSIDSLDSVIEQIRKQKITFKYIVFAQKNRISPSDMEVEFMVQLKSTKILVEGISPSMNGGSIVFIGSPAGRFIVREQPASYHISKAALEHLTKYYAVNLGKLRITVNCVLPGTILKDSNREFYSKNEEITGLLKKITPLRILGEAVDIANAVDFFCSNKATYITGQTIFIDGGQSLEGQESLARRLTTLEH